MLPSVSGIWFRVLMICLGGLAVSGTLNAGEALAQSDLAGSNQTATDPGGYSDTYTNNGTGGNSTQPATLTLNSSTTQFTGQLTDGTAPLAVTIAPGSGNTLTFNATNNTYSGATTITSGTLLTRVDSALSSNSIITVGAAAKLDIHSTNQTVSGISGSGSIFSNASSSAAGAPNSGTLTVGSGNVSSTFSGLMQDYASWGERGTRPMLSLTKTGAGTQTLAGVSYYRGDTNVQAGTLAGGATNAFSAKSALIIATGATVNLGGYDQSINALIGSGLVTNNGAQSASLVMASGITQSVAFNGSLQDGTKALGIRIDNSTTLTVGGTNNTYSGLTDVQSGAWKGAAANTFSANSVINLASDGTADLGGFDQTIAGLTGTGIVTSTGGNAALSVGAGGGSNSFAGTLQDGTDGSILSVTKVGSGTLTLSGTNTYSGATTVQAGTLVVGSAGALGAGGVLNVAAAGTLNLAGFSQTFSTVGGAGTITTSGGNAGLTINASAASSFAGTLQNGSDGSVLSLTKTGSGTLTLSGTNTYSGMTNVQAGTLTVGSAGALGTSGAVTIGSGATLNLAGFSQTFSTVGGTGTVATTGGNATLTVNTATALSFAGSLQNGSDGSVLSLTKTGSGTLTLSGANTYSGATTVQAGTLVVGSAGALGSSGAVTIGSGATLNLAGFSQTFSTVGGAGTITTSGGNAGLTINASAASSFAGSLQNGSDGSVLSLTKTGSGTLTLAGTNSYSGATNIQAGTLALGSAGALGSGGVLTIASAATLNLAGFSQTFSTVGGSGTITTSGGNAGLTFNTGTSSTFAGSLQNGSDGSVLSLTKTGSGTLTLSGANTYSGATNIQAGTLTLGSAGALGTSGAVTLGAGATLNLAGFSQTFGTVGGSGTITTSGGNAGLTFNIGAASSFSGTLQNGSDGTIVSLTKIGSGTLTLSGANTYSGMTDVRAGTLKAGGTNAFSSNSTLNIAGTASVDLGGFGQTIRALSGIGTVATTGGNATLTVNTATALSFAGSLQNGSDGSVLSLTKTGSGSLTLSGANTYSGATNIQAGILTLGSAGALGTSGAVTLGAGATLNLAGFSQTFGTVGGSGTITTSGGNAGLTFNTGAASSFSGTLQNGSDGSVLSLIKTGSGTLTLSGLMSYSGLTDVQAGTLKAGRSNAFSAASTINVASGANVDFGGFSQTLGGLTGTGTITTTGGNAGFTIGTGAVSSVFYGSLQNGSDGSILSLTKVGTGTLTLSGASNFSGRVFLDGGTLLLRNATALGSSTLSMADGTTLAFDLANATFANAVAFPGTTDPTIDTGAGVITMTGVISGTSALTKAGSGQLILTNANTYTGNTTVAQGTLEVDGSIGRSPLTSVNLNAVLAGIGTIGGLNVLGGGTIAPGNAANPTGTLTANGNVTFASGSTLAVTMTSASVSSLTTSGSAVLSGGTVAATWSGSGSPGTRYTILSAVNGVSGQFAGLTTANFGTMLPSLAYDTNNVYLQFYDKKAIQTSVQQLADDRQGQMVTQHLLTSILNGLNEQINCSGCVSGFGAIGSFSGGVHGRLALTPDLALLGGVAWSQSHSGGVDVTSAPIMLGALRYDLTDWGTSRPFAEIGFGGAPWQRSSYSRSYSTGNGTATGKGIATSQNYQLFGKLGWVHRLTPRDEVAAYTDLSRNWQHTDGYSEAAPGNPVAGAVTPGTDIMNIARFGGQWTHLIDKHFETQFNVAFAQSFASRSSVTTNFNSAGVAYTGNFKERSWFEYGARVGYRMQNHFVIDVFADGTLGAKPVGATIHGGLGLRYLF